MHWMVGIAEFRQHIDKNTARDMGVQPPCPAAAKRVSAILVIVLDYGTIQYPQIRILQVFVQPGAVYQRCRHWCVNITHVRVSLASISSTLPRNGLIPSNNTQQAIMPN